MSEIKEKIVKDTTIYSFSRIFSQCIISLKGFIIASLLGPTSFGLWNFFLAIIELGKYVDLGLTNTLQKEYPFYKGCGDVDRAINIRNNIFFGILLISTINFSIIISLILLFNLSLYYIIIFLIITVFQLANFFTISFQVENKFSMISNFFIVFGISNFISSIILTIYFNIYGALFGLLIAYVSALIYQLTRTDLFKHLEIKIFLSEFKKKIFELYDYIATGFRIMVINLTRTFLITFDKFIIIILIGNKGLGYYSINTGIIGIILYIPICISDIIFPKFSEKFGEGKDINQMKNFIFQTLTMISFIMPIIIVFSSFFIQFPIKYLLSDYIPALEFIDILLIGAFFMSFVYTITNFFISINKFNKILLINFFAIIILILFIFLFVSYDYGIAGAALGTNLTYFIYCSILMFYAFNYFENKIKILKSIGSLYFPFIYSLILIYFLNLIILTNFSDIILNLGLTCLKFTLFLILYLPILFYVDKKTNIIGNLRNILQGL